MAGRNRTQFTETIIKEILLNGETYLVPYNKYNFVSTINHGLARQFGVLPAEIPFRIKFHRAPSGFLLLKIRDKVKAKKKSDQSTIIDLDFSFPENVIPIVNPILRCFYAYSPMLSQKMSKISSYAFELGFWHYDCRQFIFDTALNEYKVPLGQGPLPQYIIFTLSTVNRSRGDESLSLTHFEQLNMIEFDLMLSKKILISTIC